MKRIVFITIIVIGFATFSSCSKKTESSTFWNDDDIRIACNELLNGCLETKQLDQAIKTMSRKPRVVVDDFKNVSSEHINMNIVTSIMKETISKNGKLELLNNDDVSKTNVDYLLSGTVNTIIDGTGKTSTRTYVVKVEMFNTVTGKVFWMGQQNVKIDPKNKSGKNQLILDSETKAKLNASSGGIEDFMTDDGLSSEDYERMKNDFDKLFDQKK